MTKEEIKEYIKTNLKVEIDAYGNEFRIRLVLEGETISSDYYSEDD